MYTEVNKLELLNGIVVRIGINYVNWNKALIEVGHSHETSISYAFYLISFLHNKKVPKSMIVFCLGVCFCESLHRASKRMKKLRSKYSSQTPDKDCYSWYNILRNVSGFLLGCSTMYWQSRPCIWGEVALHSSGSGTIYKYRLSNKFSIIHDTFRKYIISITIPNTTIYYLKK